jgi:hypothetical protein
LIYFENSSFIDNTAIIAGGLFLSNTSQLKDGENSNRLNRNRYLDSI